MEAASVPVLEQVVNLDPANKAARLMLISSAVKKKITGRLSESANRASKLLPMLWIFITIWLSPTIRRSRRTAC